MFRKSKTQKIADIIGKNLHLSIKIATRQNEDSVKERLPTAFTAAYILEYSRLIFENLNYNGVTETRNHIEWICEGVYPKVLYKIVKPWTELSLTDRRFLLGPYEHLKNTPEEYANIDVTVADQCKMLEWFLTAELDDFESNERDNTNPKSSEIGMDNANFAIKYRPEIKSILDQLTNILEYEKIKILDKLNLDPKINQGDFLKYINDVISGAEGPFDNRKYNKLYSEIFDYGEQYQEKFKKIHQTLGDTFDAELVMEEIKNDHNIKKLSKIVEDNKKNYTEINLIPNVIILSAIPAGEYQSKKHRIIIDPPHNYVLQDKSNNFFKNFNNIEDLSNAVEYKIHEELFFNEFKINLLRYKEYLLIQTSDKNVYLTKFITEKIRRASKTGNFHSISGAKDWIDKN